MKQLRTSPTPPEATVDIFWPRGTPKVLPRETFDDLEVVAEVNHGRWIVRCPFCSGAQLASDDDRRFFCVDCLHAGTDAEGKWIAVRWPSPSSRQAVEEALLRRPDEETRNFQPYRGDGRDRAETVADLRRENRAAGLE